MEKDLGKEKMANLKEIRNRIASIKSTMQITSAMKMVSAAKLKKAHVAIVQMRPYANKLTELLQNLSTDADDIESRFIEKREIKNVLLVCITSNRGLCGGFNSNVVKKTIQTIETNFANKNVNLLTIGKKGHNILSKKYNVIENYNDVFDRLTFGNVSTISKKLMHLYKDGSYDKIEIIYNQFKNAATQLIKVEPFLPIESQNNKKSSKVNFIFEPNNKFIVIELIPKSLKMQLFKAIRDSFASEHGARMTAMHKATDNATELRDDLLLSYNKARQAAITNEILEIVGGAEALNN